MAALAITAANVAYASGPKIADQVAGEAFVAGASVYQLADGSWKKAKCGGTAIEAGSGNQGMALATADAANARVSVALPGAVVTIAASGLTAGIPYFIGATAGAINPLADLVSTNKVSFAGVTISATQIQLGACYNAGAIAA